VSLDFCCQGLTKFHRPYYFNIKELVDKKTFSNIGWNALYWCFDSRLLWTADAIRHYFGRPMLINNWDMGGNLQYRGFRPFNCNFGAKFSQHRFGRAIDFNILGMDDQEVRKIIKEKGRSESCFKYINRLEDFKGMNWVHIDLANYTLVTQIKIIVPNGKTSILI